MDPLSIAASAAGLAALAGTLYKNVGQLLVGIAVVDENVDNFRRTISGLEDVLYELELTFSQRPQGNAFATRQHASIERLLLSCQSYLYSIKKRIPCGPGEAGFLQRAYTQLRFGLQTPLMTSIQGHIQTHTQMLQISLSGVVVAGHWESRANQEQAMAELKRIGRQVEEVNSKMEQRKKAPMIAFWAADADNRVEDQKEFRHLQEIADRNTKEWVYSARSVTEDMSECSLDLSSVASELPAEHAEEGSDDSDWDPEPQMEDSLPLDMLTRLIDKLQLTARNKVKAGGMCSSAEADQRRAIRLLEQRERVYAKAFSNRIDMAETLAEILTQKDTPESLEEAKKILQPLLEKHKESSPRKWRLCHLLANTYLKQGRLAKAEMFAVRALAGRKELPAAQEAVNETAKLVESIYLRRGDHAAATIVKEEMKELGEKSPVNTRGATLSQAMANETEFWRWLHQAGYTTEGSHPVKAVDPATGRNPIQHAIAVERVDIVDMIIREYSSTLELRNAHGATPLLLAAAKKNSVLVAEILRHGPDTAAVDDSGDTALHGVQSSKGGVKAAEVLLNHWTPVAIDVQNNEGKTALHLAVGLGNMKMAEMLLAKGANVNARTTTRRTPLHVAVETKRDEAMIALLLCRGAHIDARDTEDLTPLELAKHMKRRRDPLPQKSLAALERAVKDPRSMTVGHHEPRKSSSSLNRNVTSSSKSSTDHSGYVIVQTPKLEPHS